MMNYKKSKPVKMEEGKVITDPRSETSIRGKNLINEGNKNPVKGFGCRKKTKRRNLVLICGSRQLN